MDDTAEIRDRLDRIGVLADAGAGRPELLREVRGLLEEGERALRSDSLELGGDSAGVVERCVPGATGQSAAASAAGRGGEATVS
jgi:hypothetical protein